MTIVKAFDSSRHNHGSGKPIDFERAYADGYRIWFGRCSVGDYYIDEWFQRDFDGAKAAGFIACAYQVPNPSSNDSKSIDKFMEGSGGRQPDGIVIDSEVFINTPLRITQCTEFHAGIFKQMAPTLLYSNQSYVDAYYLHKIDLPFFVASPGREGSYNPGRPSLPRFYPEYVCHQRSWTQVVPGVPDSTTDLDEWQEDVLPYHTFFRQGEPMATILENIAQLQRTLDTADILVATIKEQATATPPPVVPPVVPPPVSTDITIEIIEKANSRFYKQTNANDKPIMIIYPADSAPVNERIQFAVGVRLKAKPAKVTADGGMGYWQLTEKLGQAGETLFVREVDAAKV